MIVKSLSHILLSLTCKDKEREKKLKQQCQECQQISEMWSGIKCVADSALQSIKSNSQLEGNPE